MASPACVNMAVDPVNCGVHQREIQKRETHVDLQFLVVLGVSIVPWHLVSLVRDSRKIPGVRRKHTREFSHPESSWFVLAPFLEIFVGCIDFLGAEYN